MLEVQTFVVESDPVRVAANRYAQCLRGRWAIARLAGRTARMAHVLIERCFGAPRSWLDERYPLVRFDARGYAVDDEDFHDLCAAAVGVRLPERAPPPRPVLERRPRPGDRAWKPVHAMRAQIIAAVFDDDAMAA